MTREIIDALEWLGLDYDEEPWYQSRHSKEHEAVVQQLLDRGAAYRCFCSPEELDAKRMEAQRSGIAYRYDRTCRDLSVEQVDAFLSSGKPHAVRFRVPAQPDNHGATTVFDDAVYGTITFKHSEIDDFIILRQDATVTYQLAVVADDIAMSITDVIRGDDHLSNTPKQILLFNALGEPHPRYAHLPQILGPDGRRLSKRHGATAVRDFRDEGILPAALANYLALLGWSPKDETELMTPDELISRFSLKAVSKKSAIFDNQKLVWMNGQHISGLPVEALLEKVFPLAVKHGWLSEQPAQSEKDYLRRVVGVLRPRVKTLVEFIEFGAYFFQDPTIYEQKATKKYWPSRQVNTHVEAAFTVLQRAEHFDSATVEREVRSVAKARKIPAGAVIHPLRLALTGASISPGLFEIMELLGRERVLRRIRAALQALPDGQA